MALPDLGQSPQMIETTLRGDAVHRWCEPGNGLA
jgi:hypothetical protein